jgi:hypothetical protein
MAAYLWSPQSYGTGPRRVRRNPNASVHESWIGPADNDNFRATIMPDGRILMDGAVEDALAQFHAAGPRGAAVLGAVAGFVFGNAKTAVLGGLLGYFGGKFIVNLASKALTVATVANTVAKATA